MLPFVLKPPKQQTLDIKPRVVCFRGVACMVLELPPWGGSWHPTPTFCTPKPGLRRRVSEEHSALCRDALGDQEFIFQFQLCPEKIFILCLQGLTENGGHGDCS